MFPKYYDTDVEYGGVILGGELILNVVGIDDGRTQVNNIIKTLDIRASCRISDKGNIFMTRFTMCYNDCFKREVWILAQSRQEPKKSATTKTFD